MTPIERDPHLQAAAVSDGPSLRLPRPVLFLAVATALSLCAAGAGAAVIGVNATDDLVNADGTCSLREAITAANTNASGSACSAGSVGVDTITFSLPCPSTITLTSLLPALTEAAIIDGYSNPTAAANTLATGTNATLCVVLNAGGFAQGITISAGASAVSGLVFQNHGSEGILINVGTGSTVSGNFIGTNVAGSAASGFTQGFGVVVNANGNTVGGTTNAARNLVSGNGSFGVFFFGADDGFIQGNLIGTNAAGTAAIPNGISGNAGVQLSGGSSGNLVGGPTAGARNVISGNISDGVLIFGPANLNNTVQGNFIGVNAAGTAALGNARHGVVLYEFAAGSASSGNTIDSNLIAGNPRKAIAIDGPVFADTVVTNNQIGTLANGVTAAANGAGAEPPTALDPDPAIDILHAASARVANNRILHHSGGAGVLVRTVEFSAGDADIGPGFLTSASTGNCIVGNAAGAVNDTGLANTFTNNWWGAFNGPSGVGGGSGDSVSADIVFSPFLVAAPAFTAPDGAPLQCPGIASLLEIPTLGGAGAGLLVVLLTAAGVFALRRTRQDPGTGLG